MGLLGHSGCLLGLFCVVAKDYERLLGHCKVQSGELVRHCKVIAMTFWVVRVVLLGGW